MLVCFAVFVALFRPPDLLAQNVIFSGTVEDSAGRVIVGAQVTLHTSSGAVVTARTDAAGYFFLSTGARGPATLTIEARGFEILTREIALSSAQQEQNFTLRIAGEQQTVSYSRCPRLFAKRNGTDPFHFSSHLERVGQARRILHRSAEIHGCGR